MKLAALEQREPTKPTKLLEPRDGARMFISGHSLVDQPLPDYVASIARSLELPLQWNRQYIVGSSIARRTRGEDRSSSQWNGYREGLNREGSGLDVLEELREPKTIEGGLYDVLLITEQHGLLETLIWNDTVSHLRDYHERVIAANPAATTYFYESWIGLNDKNEPQRWIEYERKVSPIWQCMATRVNLELELKGRSDRIVSVPAGLALVELIDRAQVPGLDVAAGDKRALVAKVIRDDVHLTSLGSYYMSLVTFASIFQRSPVGAWAPEDVSAETARALQEFAWQFVRSYYAAYRPLSLGECRRRLDEGLIGDYWAYIRDAYWKREMGAVRAHIRYVRQYVEWRYLLSRNDARNPFFLDPDAL